MRICGGKEKRKLQVIAHITENDTLLAEEEINAKGMLYFYVLEAQRYDKYPRPYAYLHYLCGKRQAR